MSAAPQVQSAPNRFWPPVVYPLTMGLCLGLFFFLQSAELPLLVCAYVPVILGAASILFFEGYTPYLQQWRANRSDVWNDAQFMLCVQMLLPKVLALLAAMALGGTLAHLGWQPQRLWPHHWPIAAQAVAMVLLADFLRYWLHRLCHERPLLWRLHAVHHSSDKLYWFNVGRFHPVEKALQFLVDALPFIALGVAEPVLALYFVFYAVNGFFQHCNIDLRLGPLNYLISGPQLHRWHHSRKPVEANTNYGNNIIVWDLIFGTYFHPRDRQVGELGLWNKQYPKRFWAQLKTPFSGRIDSEPLPLQSVGEMVLGLLLKIKMRWIGLVHYRPLVAAAKEPDAVQAEVLRAIMAANKNTQYGRQYGFHQVRDHRSYIDQVPICEYEDLRPYIEDQEQTGNPALTSQQPCLYNQTSGTTGAPKYIPVLSQSLQALKRSQQIFSYVQYQARPEAFHGQILGLVSPAVDGYLASGAPYGSASGHIYQTMPRLARAKYVLPREVFVIADYDIKYYLITRLALERADITYLGSANPSTFHRLLETVNSRWRDLVDDIAKGTCQYLDTLDPDTAATLRRNMRPNSPRAEALGAIFSDTDEADFADVWPYLKLLATWTGGSCAISLNSILPRLPKETKLVELGYLASEMRGTITIDPETNAGLPALRENFYEFVERDKWERGEHHFLGLGALEVGQEYYVFITTPAGLYRYHMNDIVKVVGFFEQTPTLRFVQKGQGVANITGEKLYEKQVIAAVTQAERAFALRIRFYQMLADQERARYALYLESHGHQGVNPQVLAEHVDEQLKEINLEYAAKRASKRLQPLVVELLQRGAYEEYKRHCLAKGQREGQFKGVVLQYAEDADFAWETNDYPVARSASA